MCNLHSLLSRVLTIIGIVLMISAEGCGRSDDWQAKTYLTFGSLRINGAPPEGAVVMLLPTGERVDRRDSKPYALVEPDGKFQFTTYNKGDGAPVGEYKLIFYWPAGILENEFDRLGGAYSKLTDPPLMVTVSEGKNEIPLIELSEVKIIPVPSK